MAYNPYDQLRSLGMTEYDLQTMSSSQRAYIEKELYHRQRNMAYDQRMPQQQQQDPFTTAPPTKPKQDPLLLLL